MSRLLSQHSLRLRCQSTRQLLVHLHLFLEFGVLRRDGAGAFFRYAGGGGLFGGCGGGFFEEALCHFGGSRMVLLGSWREGLGSCVFVGIQSGE